MPSVANVLTDPALRDVRALAGDPTVVETTAVGLVEELDQLNTQPAAATVVLGAAASAAANGYRLDIALRRAGASEVAALILTGAGQPAEVGPTAALLAARAGIVVAAAPADRATGDLFVALSSATAGDAPAALRRALSAEDELRRARSTLEPDDVDGLLAAASDALGAPVLLADAGPGTVSRPVFAHGQQVGAVVTESRTGHAADTANLVVALTAAAIERSLDASYRGDHAPLRSRDAILSELLVAGDAHASRLGEQARRLGVPVDGWHRAVLLLSDLDETPGLDFLHTLGSCALRAVRAPQRSWQLARWDDSVVLIEMWGKDPGAVAGRHGRRAAADAVAAVQEQFPQLRIRCGVGTTHQGIQGLRATVTEASVAAARARGPGDVVGYDTAGLQPMLLEWYGSDTARQAVNELLEPLERLGGERATTAIRTLQTYLDEQGSLVRAGDRLRLHRNAVAYRMRKIVDALDVDLDDADQRLALQLACRARLLR